MRVLRLRRGDRVTLFNGEGGEYEASIHAAGKEGVLVDVGAYRPAERESPVRLCLAQSLCAGEKMDYVLQKAVELGVQRIQPLTTERSVVRLVGERARKREQHWRNVVISACEQCGRNYVPPVAETLDFNDWVSRGFDGAVRILLSPDAGKAVRELDQPHGEIAVLAGPEGGFSPAEHRFALSAGLLPVRVGPRILRTETAALAAVAVLQTLWGDL